MGKQSFSSSLVRATFVACSFGAAACSGNEDLTGSASSAGMGVGGLGNGGHQTLEDARAGGTPGIGGNDGNGGSVSTGGGSESGGAPQAAGGAGSGGAHGMGGSTNTGGANAGGSSSTGGVSGATDAGAIDGAAEDGGVPPPICNGSGPRFATRVVTAAFGPGQNFGRDQLPGIVIGQPKGGGTTLGSLDVASLGDGGSITLAFDGNAIVDGPGADFIVFENPFAISGNTSTPYAEPGTVSVSDDGTKWITFPCTAKAYPYGACAGWHYVLANSESNTLDPTDPTVAGGDAFDLADVGVSRARFVRITDRSDLPTVFDLDAVSIVHGFCP